MSKIAQKKFEILEYAKTENATVDGMAKRLNELTRLCESQKPKPILLVGTPGPISKEDSSFDDLTKDYHVLDYPYDSYKFDLIHEGNSSVESPIDTIVSNEGWCSSIVDKFNEIKKILKCESIMTLDVIDLNTQQVRFRTTSEAHHVLKLNRENMRKVCNYVANC